MIALLAAMAITSGDAWVQRVTVRYHGEDLDETDESRLRWEVRRSASGGLSVDVEARYLGTVVDGGLVPPPPGYGISSSKLSLNPSEPVRAGQLSPDPDVGRLEAVALAVLRDSAEIHWGKSDLALHRAASGTRSFELSEPSFLATGTIEPWDDDHRIPKKISLECADAPVPGGVHHAALTASLVTESFPSEVKSENQRRSPDK